MSTAIASRSVTLKRLDDVEVEADYVIDATELGDLLPLAGAEFADRCDVQPQPENQQAFTGARRVDHVDGDRAPIATCGGRSTMLGH